MFKKLDDLNSIISSLVLLFAVFIFPYSYWVTLGGLGALVLELILDKTDSWRKNMKLKTKSWYDPLVNKVNKWSKQHPKLNMLYIILMTLTAVNFISGSPMAWLELFFIGVLIVNYLVIAKTNTWLKRTNKDNSVKYSVWAIIGLFNILFGMLISMLAFGGAILGPLFALLIGWFDGIFYIFLNPVFFIMGCCVLFTSIYGIVKKVDGLNVFLTKLVLLFGFCFSLLSAFRENKQFCMLVYISIIIMCFVSVYKIIRKSIKNKK